MCLLFIVLVIGFIARTRWKSTPETYFLADRKLGTLVLLGTMVATNFSAFTVFGTSGAGYRDHTLFATADGYVKFDVRRGRKRVHVIPSEE